MPKEEDKSGLYLRHEATVKNYDGIFDVHIIIVKGNWSKKYIYHIASEYAVRRFLFFYEKGKKLHTKALSILNQFKIKESEISERRKKS